ncbi:MAG: hypothetical protein H6Q89_4032, partial [Myxococcaceae bacterium]|nr:hypothetical protein [Myxococcaceae bacterium]
MTVLGLWLILCASPQADGGPRFQWEIPGLISDVEIPGDIQTGGVPVRLRAVLVKGNPDVLASAIVASFARQGLYVPASGSFREGLREWQVT